MRVYEVAKELGVPSESVIHLLRELGVAVTSHMSSVSESDAAKVVAKVERERRSGHESAEEAIEAAIEEAQSSTGRRRRRRRRTAPEPEPDEEAGEVVEAEAADAGEGAEEAAEAEEGEVEEAEAEDAGAGEIEAEGDVDVEPAAGEAGPGDVEVEEPEVEAEEPGEAAADAIEAAVEEAEAVEPEEAGAEEAGAEEAGAGEAEEAAAEEAAAEAAAGEAEEAAEEAASEEAGAEEAAAEEAADEEAADEEAADEGKKGPRPARTLRVPRPAASAGPGGKVRIQAEGYTSDGRSKSKKGKKSKKKRQRPDQDTVQENIQRVMAEIKSGGKKKRRSRSSRPSKEELEAQEEQEREERQREATTVKVNEFLTVAELAELIDISGSEIIGSAFKNLGLMVTMNQRLDFDQIELLLEEFGYTAVREEEYGAEAEEEEEVEEAPEDLEPRPPVVTVMGHVDHGKTLLLDYIRETNVIAGEEGGITQHIGAYHVEVGKDEDESLTFLDTPGHAAFTAMRARGADVTDIVVLVVAADDSVMPQTIEAISHAKNAGVPLVVAINKCDLPQADPMRVKQELLNHEVTVEEFGGEVLAAEVSAKTGEGVDDLLEKILLQAELLELEANPERDAQGTVIEAKLDPGKGAVTTVLVQNGTLDVGDAFICGLHDGRVRAMFDERGQNVESAGPGNPVQVLGASGVPQAGDTFQVADADRAAEIAQTRQRLDREKQLRVKGTGVKLGELSELLAEGETVTLPLIIKGDVDGSVQAVADSLEELGTDEVRVEVIHRGVGAINESDVLLATTSGAVIIGFRVRPDTNARKLAEREDVDVHTYDIIYEAVDEVRAALEGMLEPEEKERVLGSAEVRETFRISKVGTVAGCYVEDGKVDRNARVRVVRDGVVVYDGRIASLKRFQDDVREVREGFECGIGVENFNDVKVGDILECYVVEEFARTLAGAGEGAG